MALVAQVQALVRENEEMKRELAQARNQYGQLADLSYSLICVCLFSRGNTPSDDALQKALPPRDPSQEGYSEDAAEYIRRALLATRSILTDKINDLATAATTIKAVEDTMAAAMSGVDLPLAHTPLAPTEIEEVVEEFIPLSIMAPSRPRKGSGEKRARRPWMLT